MIRKPQIIIYFVVTTKRIIIIKIQ